jgi:hypothetical protein
VISINYYVIVDFIFMGLGASVYVVMKWLAEARSGFICEIYQKRNDDYVLLKRVRKRLGAREFHIGERQFVIEPNTNIYNRGHPVLRYVLDRSKTRSFKFKPVEVEVKGPKDLDQKATDPTSESTNLWFRRQGIKQMILGTRKVDLGAMLPMIIIIGIAMFGLGFVVFQVWHPGFWPGPPIGYTYKVAPIPIGNVTK